MKKPRLEVADIFRRYGEAFRERRGSALTAFQGAVMRAIEICRTAALGGVVEHCPSCGYSRMHFRSCRNRNCPKCQWAARSAWLEARQRELLDCPYFHVVFTLPAELNALALRNRVALFGMLFRAASRALTGIAADPQHLGAKIGFLAILHTWGQQLQFHPHLHCVVPGGGLSPQHDRWIACRPKFFLPVRVLSRRFRTLFLAELERAFSKGQLRLGGPLAKLADAGPRERFLQALRAKEWVVYSKRPFAGPARVLAYLARYTHRIAISNQRLLSMDNGKVRFQWRDYRDQGRTKVLELSAHEFIRRFLLHVVPPRFHRIRYYGFLAPRFRKQRLALCRALLGMPEPEPPASRKGPRDGELPTCPACEDDVLIPELCRGHGKEPPEFLDSS